MYYNNYNNCYNIFGVDGFNNSFVKICADISTPLKLVCLETPIGLQTFRGFVYLRNRNL